MRRKSPQSITLSCPGMTGVISFISDWEKVGSLASWSGIIIFSNHSCAKYSLMSSKAVDRSPGKLSKRYRKGFEDILSWNYQINLWKSLKWKTHRNISWSYCHNKKPMSSITDWKHYQFLFKKVNRFSPSPDISTQIRIIFNRFNLRYSLMLHFRFTNSQLRYIIDRCILQPLVKCGWENKYMLPHGSRHLVKQDL